MEIRALTFLVILIYVREFEIIIFLILVKHIQIK